MSSNLEKWPTALWKKIVDLRPESEMFRDYLRMEKKNTLLWTVVQLFMRYKGGIIGSGWEVDGDRLDNAKGGPFCVEWIVGSGTFGVELVKNETQFFFTSIWRSIGRGYIWVISPYLKNLWTFFILSIQPCLILGQNLGTILNIFLLARNAS